MRTLLISYYPNPNPNLFEFSKDNSGINIITVVPHAIRVVSTKTLVGLCLTLNLSALKTPFSRFEPKTYLNYF